MSAPKLSQGELIRGLPLALATTRQIIASQAGAEVMRFIVPYRSRLIRFDYSAEVGGGSGQVNNVQLQVGGVAVSEVVNFTTIAGHKTGSLAILRTLAELAPGTIVKVIASTPSGSTLDMMSAVLFTIPTNSV